MQKVGDALKKKLGPLPVWVWAILGGVAVYWYRNHGLSLHGSSTTGSTADTTGVSPASPQAGQVLEPGESYYDPNTGGLVTAPGDSGGSGGGGNTTPTPGDPGAAGPAGPPGKTIIKRILPKRKRKPKAKAGTHHTPKPKTSTRNRGSKGRPRSSATIKHPSGGRANARGGGTTAKSGRLRGGAKAHAAMAKARPRPTTDLRAQPTLQQHPEPTYPKPSPKSTPAPAPRPSAPGPRTARDRSRKR